jgi:hypothetical protein
MLGKKCLDLRYIYAFDIYHHGLETPSTVCYSGEEDTASAVCHRHKNSAADALAASELDRTTTML